MHHRSLWKFFKSETSSVCNIPQVNIEAKKIQESGQSPRITQLWSVQVYRPNFSPQRQWQNSQVIWNLLLNLNSLYQWKENHKIYVLGASRPE